MPKLHLTCRDTLIHTQQLLVFGCRKGLEFTLLLFGHGYSLSDSVELLLLADYLLVEFGQLEGSLLYQLGYVRLLLGELVDVALSG